MTDQRRQLVRERNGLRSSARPRAERKRRTPTDRKVSELTFDVERLLAKITADTDRDLAAVLGCHRTQLNKWRIEGIRLEMAEQWCERLGFFPFEIWPEYHRLIDAIYREAGE